MSSEARQKARSLFSFCAFHFIDDGFTDSIYLLLPFIAAELSLNFSEVGLLKGIFSGSMGLFQVPLSFLGERIGELTVIAAGTFGLAGGYLLLSRVHNFVAILISLVLAKVTGGGQHGLSSSLLSRVFETSGRRAAMGTYNFSGDMGKVCLPFLLALMINLWGWRQAVLVLSLCGLVAGAVLWMVAGEKEGRPVLASSHEWSGTEKRDWGIRDSKSFSSLLTIGIIDITTRIALLTFLPFLLLQKGIPMNRVGFGLTLLFAGGAVGKFACGVLAEWFGIIPMVVGTEVLTSAGILSLIWSPSSFTWFILPLLGVVLNGTSSVLYATVAEIIAPSARSRGYGLYYGITLGSGAIAPIVYGLLTDSFGLSFTIIAIALIVLVTLPLTRYLSPPKALPV
ncbi:MAG TPA: MFS transporter [Thermodesulfobacteriota bacterium]|nr:MFS transporter [Thermodesulfobacteriota bacterium]